MGRSSGEYRRNHVELREIRGRNDCVPWGRKEPFPSQDIHNLSRVIRPSPHSKRLLLPLLYLLYLSLPLSTQHTRLFPHN